MAMPNEDTGPKSNIVGYIKIGHEASHRATPHQYGFTHDWKAYVKGVDGIDMSSFVDKVIFTLHETFARPVQEVSSPPYTIAESGYASFGLKIDIVFRNKSFMHYEYDLFLPGEGQPMTAFHITEKLEFNDKPEPFRQLLLAGGAKEMNKQFIAAEQTRQQRVAAVPGAGGDNLLGRQTSYTTDRSDEDRREKKKKDKDKKKKKSKDKSWNNKDSGGKTSPVFGLARTKNEPKPAASLKSGTLSHSESSSSGSSSDSPIHSTIQVSQEPKNKGGSLSASESSSSSDSGSDEDDASQSSLVNNNHKRSSNTTSPSPHSSHNTHQAKRSRSSTDSKPSKKSERNSRGTMKKAPNGVALDVLLDLHEKMKATTDPDHLQEFVDLIEETAQYKLTDTSFDFDLCLLDAPVIHKLEAIFK